MTALAQGAEPSVPKAVDVLMRYLKAEGVEVVFGIPGGLLHPFFGAVEADPGLRLVVSRHEEGAAFMADGFARVSGRLAVCAGTSGPGVTNLLTGVACAYADGVPLLVLTGQAASQGIGKGAAQETGREDMDIDPDRVGRNYPVNVVRIGDAQTIVVALVYHLHRAIREGGRVAARWERTVHSELATRRSDPKLRASPNVPVTPQRWREDLMEVLPDGLMLFSDIGGHMLVNLILLQDQGAVLMVADPRIWPDKIARLISSYGESIPASAAGEIMQSGARIGFRVGGECARTLESLALKLEPEHPETTGETAPTENQTQRRARLVVHLRAKLADRRSVVGFGVPFREKDERLARLRECVVEHGAQARPARALAAAAEDPGK